MIRNHLNFNINNIVNCKDAVERVRDNVLLQVGNLVDENMNAECNLRVLITFKITAHATAQTQGLLFYYS
jgi:hypothetical protein